MMRPTFISPHVCFGKIVLNDMFARPKHMLGRTCTNCFSKNEFHHRKANLSFTRNV